VPRQFHSNEVWHGLPLARELPGKWSLMTARTRAFGFDLCCAAQTRMSSDVALRNAGYQYASLADGSRVPFGELLVGASCRIICRDFHVFRISPKAPCAKFRPQQIGNGFQLMRLMEGRRLECGASSASKLFAHIERRRTVWLLL
jgi:hypothetical protein